MTMQYWGMLPVAVVVATFATASGVGGATFFAPLFMLTLAIPTELAVGAALVTEVFGFASGLLAYARKRLIDYRLGIALLVVTVPMALLGTWLSERIEPRLLKAILGGGLFVTAANSFRAAERGDVLRLDEAIEDEYGGEQAETCLLTAEGEEIRYTVCNRTEGRLIAAWGGLFKGMIGTGLGELDEHFLLERCHVPSKVSVATGVFVVFFTSLFAAAGHSLAYALVGGQELATVLSLVTFTIPGVILGGQLGPWAVARLPGRALNRGLHILLLLFAALTLVEAFL
jgi:hypothetical protein